MANFAASFDFSTASDYSFVNTALDAGKLKLGTFAQTGLTFLESFDADPGFTYDSAKAEFVGSLLRQKDQTPADSLFYSGFDTSDADATWADGSIAGSVFNSASVSGGVLTLPSGVGANNYWAIDTTTSNVPTGSTGCIRFTFTPAYTGSATGNHYLVSMSQAQDNIANLVRIFHSTTLLRIDIYDSAGVSIITSQTGNTFSPVSGTPYEFELNWDVTPATGYGCRLFINGVLLNGTKAGTGTRSSSVGLFRLGRDYTSGAVNGINGTINNLIIFSTTQHVANYTPGEAIVQTRYAESKADLPNFTHLGPGAAQAITNLALTEVGAPRYIVEGQYWTGSAWAASSGTYAQASPLATVLANLASLNVVGQTVLSLSVVFPTGNTLASVDALTLTYTGTRYNASGTARTVLELEADEMVSFAATGEVTPVGTSLKYGLVKDGVLMYTTGSNVWVASNGSLAQLNTAAEVNSNIAGLLSGTNAAILLHTRMETSDPLVTPEVDELDAEYTFGGVGSVPDTCLVNGYVRDLSGVGIGGATVTFSLVKESSKEYKEGGGSIIAGSVSVETDDDLDPGYFEIALVRSSEFDNPEQEYQVTVVKESIGLQISEDSQGEPITFTVPDAAEKDITDRISGA